MDPPEGVRTDLEVLTSLAEHLGKHQYFPYRTAREIFEAAREEHKDASEG